jgi:hypothetical protein
VALHVRSIMNRPPQHPKVNNMKLTKNLGMLLLGMWLAHRDRPTASGQHHNSSIGTILALLAIVAGVSLLLGR